MANINRTYVSKLETGVTYAGLEIIGKLADALEADAAEFLRGSVRKRAGGHGRKEQAQMMSSVTRSPR